MLFASIIANGPYQGWKPHPLDTGCPSSPAIESRRSYAIVTSGHPKCPIQPSNRSPANPIVPGVGSGETYATCVPQTDALQSLQIHCPYICTTQPLPFHSATPWHLRDHFWGPHFSSDRRPLDWNQPYKETNLTTSSDKPSILWAGHVQDGLSLHVPRYKCAHYRSPFGGLSLGYWAQDGSIQCWHGLRPTKSHYPRCLQLTGAWCHQHSMLRVGAHSGLLVGPYGCDSHPFVGCSWLVRRWGPHINVLLPFARRLPSALCKSSDWCQ